MSNDFSAVNKWNPCCLSFIPQKETLSALFFFSSKLDYVCPIHRKSKQLQEKKGAG